MMTKLCPRIKECERTVKRLMQIALHAFLFCDLTETQQKQDVPRLKFDFIYLG